MYARVCWGYLRITTSSIKTVLPGELCSADALNGKYCSVRYRYFVKCSMITRWFYDHRLSL